LDKQVKQDGQNRMTRTGQGCILPFLLPSILSFSIFLSIYPSVCPTVSDDQIRSVLVTFKGPGRAEAVVIVASVK
jgi:hypothetical protein